MANRTLPGTLAHGVNTGLRAAGLTLSKLPERHTLERRVRDLLVAHRIECVLDVGAHHGEFGGMLREIGFRGRIVSFEPSSEAFAQLAATRGTDRLWSAHQMCLGSEDGTVEIQRFNTTVFNSLHAPTRFAKGSWFNRHLQPEGTESVPIRRLDTLLPELGIDPATTPLYLKIDTQGHDLQVLRGTDRLLGHINLIQTELSALHLYEDVPALSQALDHFRSVGFLPAAFFPIPDQERPSPIVEWDCIFERVDPAFLAAD